MTALQVCRSSSVLRDLGREHPCDASSPPAVRARGQLWRYHRRFIAYRQPYKPAADAPVDPRCDKDERKTAGGLIETYGYALAARANEFRTAAANLKLAYSELYETEMLVAKWDDNIKASIGPIHAIVDALTSARHNGQPDTLRQSNQTFVRVESTTRSLVWDHPRLHDVPPTVAQIMPALADVKKIPSLSYDPEGPTLGYRDGKGGRCHGLFPVFPVPTKMTSHGNE